MSNFSSFIASAGSGSTFVASGLIPSAGTAVALNTDGTVSAVAGQSEAVTASFGYTTNVGTNPYSIAFNETNSIALMTFRSTTARLLAVAGTVTATGITWGSPVTVDTNDPSVLTSVYCPNVNRFFMFYNVGTDLRYVSATVSGTTVSVGTSATYKTVSGGVGTVKVCYNSDLGTLIVVHRENDGSNSNYIAACTISAGTLTRGTQQSLFAGDSSVNYSITPVGNSRYIVIYPNGTTPHAVVVVNSSGNTISLSLGNSVLLSSSNVKAGCVYDSFNNVILFIYGPFSSINLRYRQVTAITDTTLTLGTEVTISSIAATDATLTPASSTSTSGSFVAYDSKNSKIVFMYSASGGTTYPPGCYIVSGYWSSGALVLRSRVQLSSVANDYVYGTAGLIYTGPTLDKMLVTYTNSTSGGSVARLFTNEASTNVNTIGIAQAAASNGQPVSVKLPYSIDTNQTGLTANSNYYVSGTGTLTTSAGTTNFLIGKATSATNLLITKWSQ